MIPILDGGQFRLGRHIKDTAILGVIHNFRCVCIAIIYYVYYRHALFVCEIYIYFYISSKVV